MIPFGSLALISVATTFLSAVVLSCIAFFGLFIYKKLTSKSKLPEPPFSKGGLFENCAATQVQKTLYQLDRDRVFFADIGPNDLGGSPWGGVFKAFLPTWNPIFFVSDYRLARLILTGDVNANIKECEKARDVENMNFTGLEHNSILSDRTSSTDREDARRTAAGAFSTTNLGKSWGSMKGSIATLLDEMRHFSALGEPFEASELFDMFIMRSVTRSIYGVEFTDDGTETADTIDGRTVMKDVAACAQEACRRIMFPPRPYMFWDKEVQNDNACQQRLHKVAEKLERIQREKEARMYANGIPHKPYTILDHLSMHNYKNPETRYADIITFILAATETTSSSLNYFLLEIARHPTIRKKLQYELSLFMPENRSNEGLIHSSSFNDRALLSSIAGCEYLNWCIKENMRLWPVAAGGPIRDVEEDVEYNGIRLPQGSKVICSFFSMFRERWIDRPEEYIPERWGESNPQLPQLKEMLMPFSIGRRSCLGQNMALFQLKIIIAHLLHHFDFELVGEPDMSFFVVIRLSNFMLKVKERK